MTQLTIKINWYGPFEDVSDIDVDKGGGLYMITGKRKYQRSDPEIQYIGITTTTYKTRFANHHKFNLVNRECCIWLGKIDYPKEYSTEHLKMAESIMVYFWQPELNEKLKANPPSQPTNVISHWFRKNGKVRRKKKSIYKKLPDVICWDGSHWRSGNLKVYKD
jgi:hypothetical protein